MSVRSTARRVALAASLSSLSIPLSLPAQGMLPDASTAPAAASPIVRRSAAGGEARTASMRTAVRDERAAPRRDASVAGVRLPVTADAPRPAALAPTRGRGQTLAIVGGAAFIGGLLIGDDVGRAIAVGGLAAGVYGLWLWLK